MNPNMLAWNRFLLVIGICALVSLVKGCVQKDNGSETTDLDIRFRIVDTEKSKVNFINSIEETTSHNLFTYPYIYNGSGVAVGDLNNDGLPDLVFAASMLANRIYKNLGNLRFEDVTKDCGFNQDIRWSTGIALIDINNDHLLDIYISNSGHLEEGLRKNELYINYGNFKFKDEAHQYGLDDDGHSNQLYPIDIDKDGVLEYYLINNPVDFSNNSEIRQFQDSYFDDVDRDKVYRLSEDGIRYNEVSQSIGVNNRAYGLSVAVGDMNGDNFDDLYVCNDFIEPDFFYQNVGGTYFANTADQNFQHQTFNSMGSEVADINNDLLLDVLTLDMLPQSHFMSKTTMKSMNVGQFNLMVDRGYNHQYMSNALQLNQGKGHFSEIGQLAGISNTDWSWAILCPDLDNDGWKDIFVTNGIKKAVTNNDAKNEVIRRFKSGSPMDVTEAYAAFPEYKESNIFFRNNHNLHFSNVTVESGAYLKVNSNGAIYADLDLDGDLDIVTNNVDTLATIYENTSPSKSYLNIKLKGNPGNTLGIGSKILAISSEGKQYFEHHMMRGFLSAVEPIIHIGLDTLSILDSLIVQFPTGELYVGTDLSVNQTLQIDQRDLKKGKFAFYQGKPELSNLATSMGIDYKHNENDFKDFEKEVLLPHKMSDKGPAIISGDVNNDNMVDILITGSKGYPSELWIQESSGKFVLSNQNALLSDKNYEDVSAVLFDLENDGDLDLYIVSGGVEQTDTSLYQDRVYLNNGRGDFTKSDDTGILPKTAGFRVVSGDINADGYVDIIVGGSAVPGKYPYATKTQILINNKGKLRSQTEDICPQCTELGMVNDIVIVDINNDKKLDMVVTGEWMEVDFFINENEKLHKRTKELNPSGLKGWWSSIYPTDIDDDGDIDIIVGNIGENNKFHPSMDKPLFCYANDFDHSGTLDIVLSKYSSSSGTYVPVRGRECSTQQMPFISEKYKSYNEFGKASLIDIYGDDLAMGLKLEANDFSSKLFLNEGNIFRPINLPVEAQFSCINAIKEIPTNEKGNKKYILAGNKYGAEVETVRYDASNGVILEWDKIAHKFLPNLPKKTGLYLRGDLRSLSILEIMNSNYLFVGRNQEDLLIYNIDSL